MNYENKIDVLDRKNGQIYQKNIIDGIELIMNDNSLQFNNTNYL